MNAAQEVIDAYSESLMLYHEAYAAHHGENGPEGCPCCAEFSTRITASIHRCLEALEAWKESAS